MDPSFQRAIVEAAHQIPGLRPTASSPFEAVHSIRCTDDGERLTLVIPDIISAKPPEHALTPDPQVDCESRSESWMLTARGADAAARYRAVQGVFNRTWNRPDVPPFNLEEYQAPRNPRVACVIVLNENDQYVRRCLVPSLLGYESGKDLEVLIVSNGSARLDRLQETFGPIRVMESEWGCVGRAYQAGADATSAEILAFLHDDCMASNGDWVDLTTDALGDGVGIVSQVILHMKLDDICGQPAPALPHAKAFPMVMARKTLARVGGWDASHFIGFEEFDLTLAAVDEGLEVREVDAGFVHDSGLSTILKYGNNVPALRDAFALGAIPRAFISRMQNTVLRNLILSKTGRRIQNDLLRHVLQRHPSALKRLGMKNVSVVMERLKRVRAEQGSILDNWEEMVAFDRDFSGNERGAKPWVVLSNQNRISDLLQGSEPGEQEQDEQPQ